MQEQEGREERKAEQQDRKTSGKRGEGEKQEKRTEDSSHPSPGWTASDTPSRPHGPAPGHPLALPAHTIGVVGRGQQHQERSEGLQEVPEIGQPLLFLLFVLREQRGSGKPHAPTPAGASSRQSPGPADQDHPPVPAPTTCTSPSIPSRR